MKMFQVVLGSCLVSAFTTLYVHQYITAEMLMINDYTDDAIYMRYTDDLKRTYNLHNKNIKEIYDYGFTCIKVNGKMIEIGKVDVQPPACEDK